MSISAIKHQTYKKVIVIYSIITILSIAFPIIYEQFSYGQYADCMRLLFLFPLISIIIFILCYLFKLSINIYSFIFYHCMIASIMNGCIIKGIIEISGRYSQYDDIYLSLSLIFAILSLTIFLIDHLDILKAFVSLRKRK